MGKLMSVSWYLGAMILNLASLSGVGQEVEPPAGAEVRDSPFQPVGDAIFDGHVTRGRLTQRFEIYNPHSARQLQELKEMGFTQVILDWPQLHPQATALGLDVVLANWWTLETPPEKIAQARELAGQVQRNRLAGVSMMDEPERNSPDTPFSFYEGVYQELRAHFDRELPGVGLEISHWGPLRSWTPLHYEAFIPLYQATDRIRIMPYPDLSEGPLREVYYQMLRSRRLMQLAGRDLPLIVILQTWMLPEDPKLPTIGELRVMAYQAMLGGAETVSFFSYDPDVWRQSPGFHEEFAGLMRELSGFSRRFAGAQVASRMNADGILTATVQLPGQAPVTILVNTNRDAAGQMEPLAVWELQLTSCPPRGRCRGRRCWRR